MKNNNFQLKSLQAKLILGVGLILILVGGIIIAYNTFNSQKTANVNAKDITLGQTNYEASKIDAAIEVAMDTSRTLANAFSTVKDPNNPDKLTRAQVNSILFETLKNNPDILGVYTLWEPNAFDGLDSQYANTDGTDATGRFIPYWVHGGDGTISMTPLVDYETEGAGDYYLCPKHTKNECLLDPYLYEIDGQMVLMTSTTVPIIYDGVFYGMAGADIKLDFLQNQVEKINLYNNTAKLVIISNNGTIAAATGNPELIGKPLSDMQADYEKDIQLIQSGVQDVSMEGDNMQTITPIVVGNSITPWAAQLYVPNSEITKISNQQTILSVGISIGLIILGLVVVWFVVGILVSKPLRIITQGAKLLSVGDAEVTGIDRTDVGKINARNDELGAVGRSFTDLITYFKEMTTYAQSIAAGDLTADVIEKGDTDLLGKAFVKMIESSAWFGWSNSPKCLQPWYCLRTIGKCFAPGRSGHIADRHDHPTGCPWYHPAI